ncbi:hypothetical protein CTI12_AA362680 [Artemisia annua]|uniref:HSF-type DNA-binding domain-containing protein n=1 Tax=Artemisia annua TaxID=35608 RepID=A0A2U1MMX6_ARTAN|nr:hypothetical protein CTI12_AA362680 [Artemisia annua]
MVRPNFVSKTYDIVDDPKTDHIISWINNGDAFVVWKPVELAKHVFPKYFTHTNFCSFIRQLNEYIWKDASKIVKEKEAQNQKLREQLLHMVQENSIIEYNLSEELERCKKALD